MYDGEIGFVGDHRGNFISFGMTDINNKDMQDLVINSTLLFGKEEIFMTINQMRLYILESYPNAGQKWREKVTKMPTAQIVAIYKSILSREEQTKRSEGKNTSEEYHQMDIWEYLVTLEDKGSHTEVNV